jgi:glycosyltransferase involved in cell wall biosynthesis
MITPPLVSVVLCTYNGEQFLEAQLQSILSQTYAEIEIIICDDASTDSTKKIITSYALKDNRIKYFFNETNIGVNKNFEQGFAKAAGGFIAIADQDDIWRPEKIQKQFALFTTEDILLVHTCSVIFSGEELPVGKITNKAVNLMEGNDCRKLLLRNSISGHNILFRSKLYHLSVPFPLFVYYDWWLSEVATVNGNIAASPEVLAFQRKHDNNITISKSQSDKQTSEMVKERLTALQSFLTIPQVQRKDKIFCRQLLDLYWELEYTKSSFMLFIFLLKNARVLFFYKKKWFPYISYIKAAYRLSNVAD